MIGWAGWSHFASTGCRCARLHRRASLETRAVVAGVCEPALVRDRSVQLWCQARAKTRDVVGPLSIHTALQQPANSSVRMALYLPAGWRGLADGQRRDRLR